MSLENELLDWNYKIENFNNHKYHFTKINGSKKNSGDLTKIENCKIFSKECPKADLITADGGFYVLGKDNIQEQLHLQLFFGEIITILSTQKLVVLHL